MIINVLAISTQISSPKILFQKEEVVKVNSFVHELEENLKLIMIGQMRNTVDGRIVRETQVAPTPLSLCTGYAIKN